MLKVKIALIFLSFALLFNSCALRSNAFQYRIMEKHDDFQGFTRTEMVMNNIPNNHKRYAIYAGFVVITHDDNSVPIYNLAINCYTNSWLFIESGYSLILLINNAPVDVYTENGSTEHRKVFSGGLIRETVYYNCDTELLKSISYASSIRYKLIGSESYTSGEFSKENIARFKEFYLKHVKSPTI